jgi:hypothetical protein
LSARREVVVDVVLEPAARAHALRPLHLAEINRRGIDDLGAGPAHVVERLREDRDNLLVGQSSLSS